MGVNGKKKTKSLGIRARPPVVRTSGIVYTANGGRLSRVQTLTPALAHKARAEAQQDLRETYAALPAAGRAALNRLWDFADEPGEWTEEPMEPNDLQNVLAGADGFMESGAGGEFRDTLEAAMRVERERMNNKKRKPDLRKRRDAIARQVEGFEPQMDAITDAYIEWSREVGDNLDHTLADPPAKDVEKYYEMVVVDIYRTYTAQVPMVSTDKFTTSCLVRRGFFPCAPWGPTVCFSTRLLELFRVAHLRTPTLSIQSWGKSIAELHWRPFKPYHAQQFSVSYDLYLGSLTRVKTRVNRVLGRDSPSWRRRNCCPGCMYRLEDEEELKFSILVTMDGNDSLKRVLRKEPKDFDDNGNPLPSVSKERFDPRVADAGGDYFLPRDKVDEWSRDRVLAAGQGAQVSTPPEDKTLCKERWKNLGEDVTKKMWGVYDETGVFVCLCRHSFVLMIADMVRSGELSKYPLAMVAELLDDHPRGVGVGYDIGCGFSTTLWNSPLGPKALLRNFCCLVGAFHGHAHNRLCQLRFLASYILGMGLEDLEGCEHLFSKSNAMAGSVRYSSVFHRVQTIRTYFEHVDTHEAYANLSKFIVDNYWQALEILEGQSALRAAMTAAGIDDVSEFPARLEAEFKFLKSLTSEAEEDSLQMEYYQRLVNLGERWTKLQLALADGSKSTKTAVQHARELHANALKEVHDSETKMGVDPDKRMAILKLERLVIQRMFELTKMNLSQTGYKLRKHIAKALQARSQAIRSALKSYNTAAAALVPRGRELHWSEVVEYTFLADFDLLRDPEKLGEVRPWATPAARLLLDKYFKIERAKEEIQRCNIEIRRLVTYIRDERKYLSGVEDRLRETDPGLSWCVRSYRMERERYNTMHIERFSRLAAKAGSRFTGTLLPGVRIENTGWEAPIPMEGVQQSKQTNRGRGEGVGGGKWRARGVRDAELDIDDDLGERAEGEQLAEELHAVYSVTDD
ncbi:hypothetical protein C8F04DRAFT_1272872 [Mycena alexandri]|uniref:CxC1-like cysteine cluster associated with KDZ transposases domain-containing protein n=1 Tax=Mycena alexandri TaxID=1745969 RepID=A0AAD6SAW9_9AGAR|nr:hypothetical protein C8F04DRAFT_1272872 [Mycena alexandri]